MDTKYVAMGREFDTPAQCASYLADMYFPEDKGDQWEDDRWYAMRRIEDMRDGETAYVNGFTVTALKDDNLGFDSCWL